MQWIAQTTAGYKLLIIVHMHTYARHICTHDQLKFSCLASPFPTHRVFYARILTQIKSRTKHIDVNKIFWSTTTTKCHN